MARREGRGDGAEAGFALLTVILFLLAVAAVVAPFALAARTALDAEASALRKDRLDLLAEGLVVVLAQRLASAPEAPPVSPSSVPAGCRTERLAIEARVQDQRGLVDLNAAEEELLAAALRSLGLDPGAAAVHARAVLAHRRPAGEEEALVDAADASLALEGPKRAPFEAIEEMYDFPALHGLPLRALAETFTVHSGRAEIAADRMPRGLAAALPDGPSPRFPFVAAEASGTAAYRVEVVVRSEDRTLGHAGLVAAVAEGADPGEDGGGGGGFAVLERVGHPNVLPAPRAPEPAATGCEALFGAEVAARLRGFLA